VDPVEETTRLARARASGTFEFELLEKLVGSRRRPIGQFEALDSFVENGLRRQRRYLSRSDHQHRLVSEVPENVSRELQRRLTRRDTAFRDVSRGAYPFACVQRRREQAVKHASCGLRFPGKTVRLFDLVQDFGFADDHRIESASHAEEVLHRLLLPVEIEVFQVTG